MPNQSSLLQRSLLLSPLSQRDHCNIYSQLTVRNYFFCYVPTLKKKIILPLLKQSTLRNIYDRHELVRQDVKQVHDPILLTELYDLSKFAFFFLICCILWWFLSFSGDLFCLRYRAAGNFSHHYSLNCYITILMSYDDHSRIR